MTVRAISALLSRVCGALTALDLHDISVTAAKKTAACLVPEESAAGDVHGSHATAGPLVVGQPLYPEVQHRALEGHHVLRVHLHARASSCLLDNEVMRESQVLTVHTRLIQAAHIGNLRLQLYRGA